MIYTLLYSLQNSFKNQGIGKATFLAFFLTLSALVLQNLRDVLLYANDIIQKGSNFAEAIISYTPLDFGDNGICYICSFSYS
ncbi:stage III sporulation protein AE [Caldicellulosiruptor naganoensis]|uniref:stage III sporulation protein AE n=1 Tax=Caldicellulosiruptor naganoensis TaxID=29324 RepID=UPI0038CC08A6